MKTHLIYIAIILLLFGGLFATLKYAQYHRDESNRKGDNIEALRADTTKQAAIIRITKQELKDLFPVIDSIQKVYAKREQATVTEIRSLKYRLNHTAVGEIIPKKPKETPLYDPRDTPVIINPIWNGELPTIELTPYYNNSYIFTHGCLQTEVVFDEYGTPLETISGKIEQTTYVSRYDPKWFEYIYKWKYWNKDNRPVKTETENNCGLEIEENIIFEIQ